jgi:heterotetrameric sarcosine oxidase gamma subunit
MASPGLTPHTITHVAVSGVIQRTDLTLATIGARRGAANAVSDRIRAAYGIEAPDTPRHVGDDSCALAWSGPGQWLAIAATGQRPDFVTRLRSELSGAASVSDQSGGRIVLRLQGPGMRGTLAKCLPIDLHPRIFAPGHAAVTAMGHVAVHIWQIDLQPTYDLAIPTSYAAYIVHWLEDAVAATVPKAGAGVF